MTLCSIARRVPARQQALALTLITTLASSLVAPCAYAQTQPAAENVAAARALGTQGIKLADAGDCQGAIEKLSRAESLYHAPSILGRLGECQVKVGQIVLGTENLNRVVREELAATAPKAFRDAQERAKGVLTSALPKIARLTIRVEPPEAKPEVTVGGASMPAALIGVERPTDPGTHEVTVKAPGYREYKASVTLPEGGSQEVAVRLEKDPAQAAPPPPPPPPVVTTGPATVPPRDAPPAKSNTLAYVALGVGGVGLAVGGVTGFLALSKKGDLKDCQDTRCPSSQQDTLDGAKSMATVSTVGFAVGFVGVGLGVVLLLTGGGSAKAEARARNPLESAPLGGVRVTPWLSAQSAGVSGSF
jgi:PEGA domain